MPFDKTAFGRAALALLALGFLSLFAMAGTALFLVSRTGDYARLQQQEQLARDAATRTLTLLQDAETGQRGYLLTNGDADYLAPYTRAVAGMPAALAELRERAAGDPQAAPQVAAVVDIVNRKLAELALTIRLRDGGQTEAALARVRTGEGRELMAQARGLIAGLTQRFQVRLDGAGRALAASGTALFLVTVIAAALILLVAAGATLIVRRYTSALESARREVEAVNAGLEQRVRDRTAALQEMNEEVQRFAYIVSHDLRAPLVNIMGFTAELELGQAALRELVDLASERAPELVTEAAREAALRDVPEAVGFIRSSTDRMDRLINAILRISREGRRVLAPEMVSMDELFDRIAPTVQHQLDAAQAEVVVEKPLPPVLSDRIALEQVFGNLVDNAVKYLDPARPGRIVVRGRRVAAGVEYEVSDNGRGIAPADFERIFELFRRSGPQDRPGEGIGLAHVRALLRRLGGTISCTSRLGVGSTFRVSLPVRPVIAEREWAP
jgi:signal transduction histidine kinase